MKKKKIIGLISLFMCVCLVGVGFAAWVVTGDAKSNKEGNLQVETVDDQRLGITDVKLDNPSIIFGAPASVDDNGKWLQASGVKTEVLSTTLTFSISNNDQCTGVDITITPAENDAVKYNKAVEDNLIASPSQMGITTSLPKEESGNYSIKFTWAWGSEFSLNGQDKGKNPYTFYNELAGGAAGTDIGSVRSTSTTNADYALAALGTTAEEGLASINNVKFVIGITAKSTANAE